jgi:hypothetical protein
LPLPLLLPLPAAITGVPMTGAATSAADPRKVRADAAPRAASRAGAVLRAVPVKSFF